MRYLVIAFAFSPLLSPGLTPAAAQAHRPLAVPRPAAKPDPIPAGPTVLIDTTLGRLTCRLFSQQAPLTAANFVGLASGSKDWIDPATDKPVHSQPFYDATALAGIADGVSGGDRLGSNRGVAGPPFATEKSGLGFDRAGRLVMAGQPAETPGAKPPAGLTSSSLFYVLAHADLEYIRRGGTVFGQCDDASLPVVAAISHALLSVDNHPVAPLAINHITVLDPSGSATSPTPPLTPDVPAASIMPQPASMPPSAIPAPDPTGPTAIIDTTLGPLNCRLFDTQAPVATANFIGLATGSKDWHLPSTHALMHHKRFYDGLTFRRVIPDFMIQNADMPSDPEGGGDLGFHFPNEIVPGLTFDRPGRLAYANGGPDTNQSEFFLAEHPMHRLDGNYTIFGQCDDASVKVGEAIARVPRDEHNRPLTPAVIRHIAIAPAAR